MALNFLKDPDGSFFESKLKKEKKISTIRLFLVMTLTIPIAHKYMNKYMWIHPDSSKVQQIKHPTYWDFVKEKLHKLWIKPKK